MRIREMILALVLGFMCGYLLVCLLESEAKASNRVKCYYDSTPVVNSVLETGWRCK